MTLSLLIVQNRTLITFSNISTLYDSLVYCSTMPVEQLIYEKSGQAFLVLADPSILSKFRNGEATAAEVVDAYEVFKFFSGKQG